MPQPCEFNIWVQTPGSPVSFWDAFAATVGRIAIPVVGQTFLKGPSNDVPTTVRHAYLTENCIGGLLQGERLLTPQFTTAGWPDLCSEIRQTYAAAELREPLSSFYASIPLCPKPLTLAAPLFRYRLGPEQSLTTLAFIGISARSSVATASVSLDRDLLTEFVAEVGLSTSDIVRLITDINSAYRDLVRTTPGKSAGFSIAMPGINMLPEIEELLSRLKADASRGGN